MRSSRRAALLAAVALVVPIGVTVAAQTAAQAGTAFGYGTPTYVNSAAPSSFSNAQFAGEPSVGVNWTSGGATGTGLYQSYTDTYKLSFDANKSPIGITWSDVSSPYSLFNLDPILATDPTTGLTLAGGDNGPCAVMSLTSNDGTSWSPSAPCPFAADHETVGFGPFVAGARPVGSSGDRAAYFCQQSDLNVCARSVDGGKTWAPGVSQLGCFGTFGHVKSAADGTAYIPNVNCADSAGNLAVGGFFTKDNGLTWTDYGILGATEPKRGFDPSIATTPDGTVYETWARDGDYHPVVASTKDVTGTWTAPVDLANTISPPILASTFQAAVAGDNGRVAVAYLGTQTATKDSPTLTPFDAGYHGVWYLFVSTSYDGGKTWTTVRASDEPVQRGSISDGGTTSTSQRNLLDFIDASVTKDGRVLVGYADGCLGTCNGPNGVENAATTDNYATVALQSTGKGLFASRDVTPVSAPDAPVLSATGGTNKIDLTWAAPADGGSPITGYQVSRGTTPGGETPLASTTTTGYTDTTAVNGTTYYYRVTATNAVGSTPSNEVAATTRTTTPAAPTLTATGGKGTVSLSWTVPADGGLPITSWTISRGVAAGAETPIQTITSGTSYVDNQVTAGTTYWYRVSANNANGAGAASNEASATPRKGR